MTNNNIILEAQNLHKSYRMGQTQVKVLKGVNFKLTQGEFAAVIGASGSGKSTLLHILGALDKPDKGRVCFRGNDLSKQSGRRMNRFRNKTVGFVFQFYHLLDELNVLENVLLPTIAGKSGESKEQAELRAVELLEQVGLKGFSLHRPGELSGGQRQRVAVVRALINRPGLLLADEPTGSLDRDSTENIAELLVELNRSEDVTLIVVTHSSKLAGMMGRFLQLEGGTLREGTGAV